MQALFSFFRFFSFIWLIRHENPPIMRILFLSLALFVNSFTNKCLAATNSRHVLLVVWDGMRPDFITAQYSPTLYQLARRGVFFSHHHSVYLSATEVNGT